MTDLFSYISEEDQEKEKDSEKLKKEDRIFSIHEITMLIKGVIEPEFSDVWVEGEISNYKKHTSGHHYFSLKDDKAVISCVMWKSTGDRISFEPDNGQMVKVRGSVSLYEGSGRYQIDVKKIIISGIGELQARFEALKLKLYQEGLFDPSRKKCIPYFIKNVGVVTAETGAAFQDIKKVIRSRAGYINIYIYNARVQGKGTETEIVDGIEYFNSHREIADVIIIGRGGGSLEDLWSFNEESVARAIYNSKIPVISAVGHEIDFSISDFTADLRAATPSQAAELVSINVKDEIGKISQYETRLKNMVLSYFQYHNEKLKGIENSHAFKMPADLIKNHTIVLDNLEESFKDYFSDYMQNEKNRVDNIETVLISLNPVSIINRGFAVIKDKMTSKLITASAKVKPGQKLEIKFKDGSVSATAE
jgi:exodeoxyribonuclease VII large subunit